jgi:hypothetical protein
MAATTSSFTEFSKAVGLTVDKFLPATTTHMTPGHFESEKRCAEALVKGATLDNMARISVGAYYERHRAPNAGQRLATAEYALVGFSEVAKLLENLNERLTALETENSILKERVNALEKAQLNEDYVLLSQKKNN